MFFECSNTDLLKRIRKRYLKSYLPQYKRVVRYLGYFRIDTYLLSRIGQGNSLCKLVNSEQSPVKML